MGRGAARSATARGRSSGRRNIRPAALEGSWNSSRPVQGRAGGRRLVNIQRDASASRLGNILALQRTCRGSRSGSGASGSGCKRKSREAGPGAQQPRQCVPRCPVGGVTILSIEVHLRARQAQGCHQQHAEQAWRPAANHRCDRSGRRREWSQRSDQR